MPEAIADRKRELRRHMRGLRISIDDQSARAVLLWSYVRVEPAVRAARTVMVYTATAGEPDADPFVAWCRRLGKHVLIPEPEPSAAYPADPRSIDVVIVPGLAFTRKGERLGQGGGWYDSFLHEVRDDCTSIGVGFAPQLVAIVPTDPHDVRVDVVITDEGRVTPISR